MDTLFQIDWQQFFLPQISIIELVLRGSLVYLMLLGILRFLPSRQVGGLGISDLLVIVLVATAVQDAMATKDSSIIGGLILATTIVCWSYLFTWLSHKFPAWQRFLSPPPLLLVKDGEILQQNMQRGLISKRELMSQLRQQGVHSLNKVKKAYIEGDGRISIFTRDSNNGDTPDRQFPAPVTPEEIN
ncbi:MAG: DUF421 domain-containing protein [Chroococcidiopsidaceae cyanobacterium CP_BM_ER_R8_30]|nr:DUF421 domain-containing protein [Chroococcidiopsidaceae cyanobacterium CP_BM_ER_R8_30]